MDKAERLLTLKQEIEEREQEVNQLEQEIEREEREKEQDATDTISEPPTTEEDHDEGSDHGKGGETEESELERGGSGETRTEENDSDDSDNRDDRSESDPDRPIEIPVGTAEQPPHLEGRETSITTKAYHFRRGKP